MLEFFQMTFGTRQAAWNWDAISAVSAAVGVLLNFILVVSIWIAVKTLREAEKSRLIGIVIWTTERVQAIRDDTYKLLEADLSGVASDAVVMHECRRISAEYEQISYFVRAKLISEQHIFDMYGGLFVRVWNKLEPAILEIRRQDGEVLKIQGGTNSRSNFEALVNAFRPRLASQVPTVSVAVIPPANVLNERIEQ